MEQGIVVSQTPTKTLDIARRQVNASKDKEFNTLRVISFCDGHAVHNL